jgi:hypothetical protein
MCQLTQRSKVLTPLEGLSFLALVVWMVTVSILMFRRNREGQPAPSTGGRDVTTP